MTGKPKDQTGFSFAISNQLSMAADYFMAAEYFMAADD
jgi:hypothetical protein